MRVYIRELGNPYQMFHIISHYQTPRAILIEYLNDSTKHDIVHWIEEGKTFDLVNIKELMREWAKRSLRNPAPYRSLFDSFFGGGIQRIRNPDGECCGNEHRLLTNSTDKRTYVHDLVAGPLIEWIVKFLLEMLRIDFLNWVNKDTLEFRIYDVEGFGKTYAKVNKYNEKTHPVFLMKFHLSSYCNTGIMKAIDESCHHYQFDKDAFEKECAKKPADIAVLLSSLRPRFDSHILFPEITIYGDGTRHMPLI